MNATIIINGAHATITINDYSCLSSEAKNRILNFVLDDENETIGYLKRDGYIVITGELKEMQQLFKLLWDLM